MSESLLKTDITKSSEISINTKYASSELPMIRNYQTTNLIRKKSNTNIQSKSKYNLLSEPLGLNSIELMRAFKEINKSIDKVEEKTAKVISNGRSFVANSIKQKMLEGMRELRRLEEDIKNDTLTQNYQRNIIELEEKIGKLEEITKKMSLETEFKENIIQKLRYNNMEIETEIKFTSCEIESIV